MITNAAISQNLTRSRSLIRQYSNKLLPRFTALMAIFAIMIPTLFIIPTPKVSAREVASSYVSAPPEAFVIGSSIRTFDFVTTGVSAIANNFALLFLVAAKPIAGLESATEFVSQNSVSSNSAAATPTFFSANATTRFDFDGDGKSDIARFQKTTGEWRVKSSVNSGITNTILGSATSKIVPADYDGDGKTDLATFDNGVWTIKRSATNTTVTQTFGISTDKPVVGDYDGDGLADIAVYRAGTWYVRQSSNGIETTTVFGNSTDIPTVGDFDNDGKNDFVIYRPGDGVWHRQLSTAGYSAIYWGISTDIPVPADFDGDGKTDCAVFRPTTGTWYVYKSSTNNGESISQTWGNYGDQPTPADFDGDGKAEFSVWRPTTGVWHTIKSNNGNPQFSYEILGIAGDTAIQSAYIKQTGSTVSASALAKARLAPINETGGTSLYSRNFGWGTALAELSGRGLNAGFGISYNSLIWTKQTSTSGSSIIFDADNSNVSPGFRFGFPVIEPSYFDKTTDRYNFIMVSPNGSRTEFRQIGATNVYETADSSYTQLTFSGASSPNSVEQLNITVTRTDGTTMSYAWNAGAYRCTQVKDANGNFITITHNNYGLLSSVKDTLGRIINVTYNSDLQPTTITQAWQNGTHTYVTLSYTTKTITTNFDTNLTIYGPPNETVLKVLDKITFADNSSVRFDYNSYGQVQQVNNHAADGHKLNHTRTNLDSITTVQADCPRFTETKNFVQNFNGEVETTVKNEFLENEPYTLPNGGSANGTMLKVYMIGDPHARISKTFTGNSGWKEGLPIKTEDFVNNVQKRWTWTNYTQDDETLTYIKNPRVTESKVGDTENGNIRRTKVEYNDPAALQYGLPTDTLIYDTDQTTILKKSTTEYNLSSVYTNRRIIGLPSKSESYGLENGVLKLTGKATYAYDEGNFSDTTLEQNIAPIQHDNTNYAANFIIGRGNTTSVTRWNVETGFENDPTQAQKSQLKYNTAGSPVASVDVMNRTIKTSYADKFEDNINNRNTYAYPTKLTDPAGNFSQVKYRFDIGANVWAKSPTIDGNAADSGKETTREFDTIGRPIKETLVNTGAYSRYEYLPSQIQSMVYTTITDADNNGIINTADEVLSESLSDGAGRTRLSRTELPNSTGGFSGNLVEYDILGQVKRTSVPTEIGADWLPAGDDSVRGFLWTSQEFDWKGRVTKEINTDGTDKLIIYTGCGCAGGQVTTIEGELVPRDDLPNAFGRRKQKIYSDILGRSWKTETFKFNGDVYSTNLVTFSGRDQETSLVQQDNSVSPMISQTTAMTYDGFGRMKSQHIPQQDQNTATVYNYNSDNTVQNVTDARGATSHFIYNSLGLLQQKSYSVPSGSNIPVTPTVTYTYDNMANRTQMVDGLGTATYQYDQFSRMTSETRGFTGNSNFTTSYSYQFNGALKTITDPSGETITWGSDKAGRNISVTNTVGSNVNTLISDQSYRAWGGRKKLVSGTGHEVEYNYNNRLQLSNAYVSDTLGRHGPNNAPVDSHNTNYTYNADSTMNLGVTTITANSQAYGYGLPWRSYKYDSQTRVIEEKISESYAGRKYKFNAFNNAVYHEGWTQGQGEGHYYNTDWLNNRMSANSLGSPEATYDADGRMIKSKESALVWINNAPIGQNDEHTFDAVGNLVTFRSMYDGDEYHNGPAWLKKWNYGFDGDSRRLTTTNIYTNESNIKLYSTLTGNIIGSIINNAFTKMSDDNITIAPGVESLYSEITNLRIILPNDESLLLYKNNQPYNISTGNSALGSQQRDSLGSLLDTSPVPEGDPPLQVNSFDPLHEDWEGTTADLDKGCSFNGQPWSCADVISRIEGNTTGVEYTVHSNAGGFETVQVPINSHGVGIFGHIIPPTWARSNGEGGYFNNASYNSFSFNSGVTGTTFVSRPLPESTSQDCLDALTAAGKDEEILKTAQGFIDRIKQLTNANDSNARLMAVLGLVESDAVVRKKQLGGGPGRGFYQIEPKAYGISEEDALDFDKATVAVSNALGANFADILDAYDREFGSTNYQEDFGVLYGGLIRTHNRWRPGVVYRNSKDVNFLGDRLKKDINSSRGKPLIDFSSLDEGTSGGRGGYVTKVYRIWFHCR